MAGAADMSRTTAAATVVIVAATPEAETGARADQVRKADRAEAEARTGAIRSHHRLLHPHREAPAPRVGQARRVDPDRKAGPAAGIRLAVVRVGDAGQPSRDRAASSSPAK